MSKNVLNSIERLLILNVREDHNIYNCSEHGIFSKDKEITDYKCPFKSCNGSVSLIENVDKLLKTNIK